MVRANPNIWEEKWHDLESRACWSSMLLWGALRYCVIAYCEIPSDQACSIHEGGWHGWRNGLERYLA